MSRHLGTASNLIEAIRTRDFGHRARHAHPNEPLSHVLYELNRLADHLQHEHLHSVETTAFQTAILERTEIALLTFDDQGLLRSTNRAAERLFQIRSNTRVTAHQLGIAEWFEGPFEKAVSVPGQPVEHSWEVRRGTFSRKGQRYVFFLASDSRRVRREHERSAWQRLIRVIGHEVNNTLTPIHSLASTSLALVREDPLSSAANVAEGLALIEQRSQLLLRFISEYARLAKLPAPQFLRVRVHECMRVAVDLEQRGSVRLVPGPEVMIDADRAQLEQALVNLIRNAVEAMAETGGTCQVSWACEGHDVVITVLDEGTGVANVENLFVPFFSTKPNGSGIGLTLSRHIIESHGGELRIANRQGQRGCSVRIRLPLIQSEKPALAG